MRNIHSTRDFGTDRRLLSIKRVQVDPANATFYRTMKGVSTIKGAPSEVTACTVQLRFMPVKERSSMAGLERHANAGDVTTMTWRFEVPYPTDANGATPDMERGDRVAINGADYRCTFIENTGRGYWLGELESWD